jgi:hypothetical protein
MARKAAARPPLGGILGRRFQATNSGTYLPPPRCQNFGKDDKSFFRFFVHLPVASRTAGVTADLPSFVRTWV